MGGRPELFDAFGDPDFQFSLGDAGRAAASNDDEHTEQLLVDLLANRAVEGNAARVRLATSHAIKAADKLSLEALNGLTALWALTSLGGIAKGYVSQMASARSVADTLIGLPLPTDNGWVRDVDVLNLVRVHPGGVLTRTPYLKMLQHKVAADLICGLDPSSAQGLIDSVTADIPELRELIVPHPLKPGCLRLAGDNETELMSQLPVSAAESTELKQLIGQNGYGGQDNTAMATLSANVAEQPNLVVAQQWWDGTPSLEPTIVGEVIGFVNARRHILFTGTKNITELLQSRAQ